MTSILFYSVITLILVDLIEILSMIILQSAHRKCFRKHLQVDCFCCRRVFTLDLEVSCQFGILERITGLDSLELH